MKAILYCILGFVLFMLLLYAVFAIMYRSDAKDEIKISYNRFIKLYTMNPYKWDTRFDDCVFYEPHCKYFDYEKLYFKSYFDVLRYRNFKHKKESIITKNRVDVRTIRLIKYWQDDINQYKQNYYYEMQRMSEELKEYEQKTKEKIKTLELHYGETAEKE